MVPRVKDNNPITTRISKKNRLVRAARDYLQIIAALLVVMMPIRREVAKRQ